MGRKVQKHECRCIFDVFLEVYATICLFDFEKTKLLIKLSILEEYATKLGNEHQTKKRVEIKRETFTAVSGSVVCVWAFVCF